MHLTHRRYANNHMRILNNFKRVMAVILSITTCLTSGLVVSANEERSKVITINMGSKEIKKLPLVYSDDYFNKSSFQYNNSLATASLALELSGFADISDYKDQAKHAKQALQQLGFDDIEENVAYKQKSTANSIGVVTANKKIKANNEDYTLIPVILRGGGYEYEWTGNAKVGKTGDHQGFDVAAQKAKDFVDGYMKNRNIEGKVKLWIVGYSRGGAAASLLGVKFNKDFIPILKKLNTDCKGFSNEDYYKKYIEKEKTRTRQKYGKNIEINPNDLYVYTFEAPMAMSINSGSGLEEYKGDIPYSASERNNRAIYDNIHNMINDDDLITKVAPQDWGFARPGVDHKLLEDRNDKDIKNMEAILSEFLVNKEGIDHKIKYVGNKLEKNIWKNGIHNYSEFSDYIIDKLTKSIDRVRREKYANINMSNREFYDARFQKAISKLVAVAMADKTAFGEAIKEATFYGTWKNFWNSAKAGAALFFDTNYLSGPIGNLLDTLGNKLNVDFDKDDKKAIVDLLSGLDQNSQLPFLLYCVFNISSVLKMHEPEVHLATLISKDKNREMYIKQINRIKNDYSIEKKKREKEFEGFVLVEKPNNKNQNKNVSKKEEISVNQLVEDKKNKKENKKENKKSGFIGDFVDFDAEYSKYGIDRALDFEIKQKNKEKANAKGIALKAIGVLNKGVKSGVRFMFSPISETKNIFGAVKDAASYLKRGNNYNSKKSGGWFGCFSW